MWQNQAEIEHAEEYKDHLDPNVRKGVHLLYRLMQAVNAQSDGWPYWKAPSHAASKLTEILDKAGAFGWGGSRSNGVVTDAELRKAVTPIKAMVTRQSKKQKQYGNTFAFDVDAALQEVK